MINSPVQGSNIRSLWCRLNICPVLLLAYFHLCLFIVLKRHYTRNNVFPSFESHATKICHQIKSVYNCVHRPMMRWQYLALSWSGSMGLVRHVKASAHVRYPSSSVITRMLKSLRPYKLTKNIQFMAYLTIDDIYFETFLHKVPYSDYWTICIVYA